VRWLQLGDVVDDVLDPYRDVERTPRGERPWVLANMVCDLTGSTTIDGRVGALSTGADVELFRRLRSVADVVLVGAETVRRERYGPVRIEERDLRDGRPAPQLAVVSRSLDFDWTIPMFGEPDDPAGRSIVITCGAADEERIREAGLHASVMVVGEESVDLAGALEGLAIRGAGVVVCEGGPHVLGGLVAAGCLDELCLTITPLIGGDPLPVAVLPPGSGLHDFHLVQVLDDDGTLFLRYEREPRDGR
jgi:riboflavin biosynthesis pyrimidine reductase